MSNLLYFLQMFWMIIVASLSKLDFMSIILSAVGKLFGKLIILARKWNRWDKFKQVVTIINHWTTVMLEVYEDDELTPEEELRLANELKKTKIVNKLSEVIDKNKQIQ